MSARPARTTLATVLLAALAAVTVLLVSAELFPYHSVNHDEGVYLQQARLLVEGRLWFEPTIPEAFRWWFFIEDAGRLYPKYAPVPAAVFALGMALGTPRLSLVVVAFGTVLLVGLVTAEAFDRRTGLVAAGVAATTPLFLIQSATFLPYAVTTLFNLTFALGYVRAFRRESYAYAALAGVAVGAAFFSRPYTSVLFATPFVLHASYALLASFLEGDRPALAQGVLLNGLIAVLGLCGVALALAYNAVVVGDPFTFPYEAFAPADGIGFGEREILGYSREYTPALALRANALVVESFLTRWAFSPPVGPLLALVGLLVSVGPGASVVRKRAQARESDRVYGAYDEALRVTLAGVAVTVALGNVLFWGNLNVLADLSDPTDGLIASLGPFYHFDLLLPFSAFAAAGLVFGWRRLRQAVSGLSDRQAHLALAAVLLTGLAVGGAATASALSDPVERNLGYSERYSEAYAPFEERTGGDWAGGPLGTDPAFDRAVVFVPTPYGGWLGHPFQSLMNDGDLDGPVRYALDGGPDRDFAVLDASEGRTPYRYTYRGEWTPDPAETSIQPAIQRLRIRSAERQELRTTVGVLGSPSSVRLEVGDRAAVYDVSAGSGGERLTVPWVVEPGRASVSGAGFAPRGDGVVTYDGAAEVSLAVTFVQDGGATVTYRQTLTVREVDGTVEVVWPPETRVCRLTPDCGRESTYVPGADDYLDGVTVDAEIGDD